MTSSDPSPLPEAPLPSALPLEGEFWEGSQFSDGASSCVHFPGLGLSVALTPGALGGPSYPRPLPLDC